MNQWIFPAVAGVLLAAFILNGGKYIRPLLFVAAAAGAVWLLTL